MSSIDHLSPGDPRAAEGERPTRRAFLGRGIGVLGGGALTSMFGTSQCRLMAASPSVEQTTPGPHFAPKALHVIYLPMVGVPSQLYLFVHTTQLTRWSV